MKRLDKHRRRASAPLTAVSTALLLAASCSHDDTKSRGELMVAVSTDLSITEDMDQVGLQVFNESGQILSSQDLDIRPAGDFGMPGTIALIPPDAGGQRLLVRVSAKHTNGSDQTTAIVREAIVRVPTDRVALLRMPLYWLCKDKVKVAGQSGDQDLYSSDCDPDQTCQSGVCVDADVSANDMPDYSAALVFGGGNAQGAGSYCLDVDACFGETQVSPTPDSSDCSLPLPAGADPTELNVALVLPPNTDGHCLDDPLLGPRQGNCYIPLDQDPSEGYAIQDSRIVLPPQACLRASVQGIAVSTACPKKDLSVPICGPWTGWNTTAGSTGGTGGTSVSLGGPNGEEAGSSNAGENSGNKGGSNSVGAGATGGGGITLDTAGEAGAAPVCASDIEAAELAHAYYYVLLDRSAAMQMSLTGVRQALQQFGTESQSAGIEFGLQLTQDDCQGDYSQPALDFTALPNATQALPNFQASPQQKLQLDDAMTQTLQTLTSVSGAVSRTLVVITSAFDAPGTQGCADLTDVMQQAVQQALSSGVSLRPVIVVGQDQPNLSQGFQVNGAPQPVQMSGTNFQATSLVSALASFRDAVVPCTFVAPSVATYSVDIRSADGATQDLVNVGSTSACGTTLGYYASGSTFVLCPSACTSVGSGTVETNNGCSNETGGGGTSSGTGGRAAAGGQRSVAGGPARGGAPGRAGSVGTAGSLGTAGAPSTSCPKQQPSNGAACTGGAVSCPYNGTQCLCLGTMWICQ